jgi:2'-hydroxyisoflavone reductase
MKLLVLGGTRFLGRHVVDAALARGDAVTIFTRGRQINPWGAAVTALTGNRDPGIEPRLSALDQGTWDAAIDISGYVPRLVRASAELLAPRVGRYLFVSTFSVYADASRPGLTEDTAVGTLDDPATEEVAKHYGPLKAACERVVTEVFGGRATIVRPGLIVGPFDPTDRFAYWVARFVHPRLLGDRPASAVVPAPRERPVQFIDARDLAAWMLALLAGHTAGTFNGCAPARQWTFGDLVDALSKAGGAAGPRPAWIAEAMLLEMKVTPWTGLPLWIPGTFEDMRGFMEVDCTKAQRSGLGTRALAATIADTAAWLAQRDNAGAWNDVLSADVEREVLASSSKS